MKVVIIGTGFGRYGMAPVFAKVGFDSEIVSPRDGAAIDRALAAGADLVSVHSPPFMHREHVMKALERGLAVNCDKPFGMNGAQAREMRDRTKQAGVLNFLNCEFWLRPSRVEMKKMIDAGAIGEVQHISGSFITNGLRGRTHAWLNEKESGGGWVGAWGSHFIDGLRWMFGVEVTGCGGVSRIETRSHPDAQGKPREATAEDAFSAWFTLSNGITASIDTAFSAAVTLPSRMIAMGSTGALELVNDSKLVLRRAPEHTSDPSLPREERLKRAQLGMEGELVYEAPVHTGEVHEPALLPWLTAVKAALGEGRQITPSFDDGVAVAEAMDLLKSRLIPAGRGA